MTRWQIPSASIDETYAYDTVGNITQKGPTTSPTSYSYTYTQTAGLNGGSYAVRSTTTNGVTQAITYDGNGNTLNSGGRLLTWNADNQPTQASNWPTSEQYLYDADGERVKRTNVNLGVTTYYLGGLYEKDTPSNTTRSMYQLNGQVIAQRSVNSKGTQTVSYLHSGHLGSVSAVSNSIGSSWTQQEYDPWGKVRPGGNVLETKLNYTGQKLDDTGVLYYHARYYDPVLGRFVSPDSIVPGASSGVGGAGGTVGQEQNSKLTVDFHESGFLTGVQGENQLTLQKGFWFQLSSGDRSSIKAPWGPENPQALNRYAYVLNNPIRYSDPSGHEIPPPDFYQSEVQQAGIGGIWSWLLRLGVRIIGLGGKAAKSGAGAAAGIGTRIGGAALSSQALQKALQYATDTNKLNHIFGKT